jgi:hypothetical protein
MHKEGGRVTGVLACLVGMVHSSQSTEARLDLTIGSIEGNAEVGIVGRYTTLFVVGFKDGVAEVGGDDEDVNVSSVGVVTG